MKERRKVKDSKILWQGRRYYVPVDIPDGDWVILDCPLRDSIGVYSTDGRFEGRAFLVKADEAR